MFRYFHSVAQWQHDSKNKRKYKQDFKKRISPSEGMVRRTFLGATFFYKNLCFINQVDGGDEWLTIKDDYAFESFSFSRIIRDGRFKGYI